MTLTTSPDRSHAALATLRSVRTAAASAGIGAGLAGLGAAELVALVVSTTSGPVEALGSLVINHVPAWLKSLVIAIAGTNDKTVLIASLVVVAIVVAALAGLAGRVRPIWGVLITVVAFGIAAITAATRDGASGIDAVPSIVGLVIAAMVLTGSLRRIADWAESRADTPARREQAGVERRRFLVFAIVTAGLGAAAATGALIVRGAGSATRAAVAAVTLPKAAVTAPKVPAGASLDVDGLTPLFVPNADFYRIDTALVVPSISPTDWQLKITGMVQNEVTFSYADILALPLEEHDVTIGCVSNEVGGDLLGNARWLGYPIRELLAKAAPTAAADMVLSSSSDGFSAGTPLSALTDPNRAAILAVGMNGEVLPAEHGFPARMIVPGLYGYVSATKWVVEMKVSTYAQETAYWTSRGWSAKGPIKQSSRIDVPANGSTVDAGTVTVAGLAWAQHTGVAKVEVRVDGGAWQTATLADAINRDAWRQWKLSWKASAGKHTLEVRSTDAAGSVQTSTIAPTAPNGSSGWDAVSVTVS